MTKVTVWLYMNCLQTFFFSSAVYLAFQTSQHTLPRVEHFVKLRACIIQQQPYSFSKCVRNVRTIQQQCGANHILSVNFHVCDIRTIQQQCGANRILSVYFCVCAYVSFSNSVGQTVFFQCAFVFATHVPFSNSVRQTVFFQYIFANGMCVCIQQQCM